MNPISSLVTLSNPGSYVANSGTTGKTAFAANVGATQLLAADAINCAVQAGQYRVDVTIVATVLATLAPNCAFNVIGNDAAGAYTNPIPLDAGLTGTVGASFNLGTTSRASGSLLIDHDATAPLSFSITGITTPGPLAAKYQITLTRVG